MRCRGMLARLTGLRIRSESGLPKVCSGVPSNSSGDRGDQTIRDVTFQAALGSQSFSTALILAAVEAVVENMVSKQQQSTGSLAYAR